MAIKKPNRGAPTRWGAVFACAAVMFGAACRRDEVTHAQVPKTPTSTATAASGMPPMGGPGGMMGGDVPPAAAPSGADAVTWTLPKGWTESRSGGGMRYATLKPPVEGKVDVSIITLPGEAGGELANVNRWRGQIGLPPLDQGALAGARETVKSPAGPVSVYDFTGEGGSASRMVAGLLVARGNSWFIKMVGDPGPVAAARAGFIHLLETLRLGSSN